MNTKVLSFCLLLSSAFMFGCGQADSNQVKTALMNTNQSSESGEMTESMSSMTMPTDAPTYRVLVDTSQPPYSYRDDSGKIVGFEVDLLKEIAKKELFHLQLITSDSAGLFDDLAKSENHAAASAIEISPEIKQDKGDVAVFSDSYISTQPVAVYMSEKAKDMNAIQDGSIGVKKGASFLADLQQEVQNQNAINYYDSSFLAFKAMVLGETEASVNDIQVAFHYIDEYKSENLPHSIKIAPVMNKKEHNIVFAVSKDKPEVLQALNAGIERVKNDGSYEEIAAKWLQ